MIEVSEVRVLIADCPGEEYEHEQESQDEPTAIPPTAPLPTLEPTHESRDQARAMEPIGYTESYHIANFGKCNIMW